MWAEKTGRIISEWTNGKMGRRYRVVTFFGTDWTIISSINDWTFI